MSIISSIFKGIGSGIGLAAEVIAECKGWKAAAVSPNTSSTQALAAPPSTESQAINLEDESDSSSDEYLENEKAEVALGDDAVSVFDRPLPYSEEMNEAAPIPVDDVARESIQVHPTAMDMRPPHLLPLPVILPQKRPKDRSRGFVRAYTPLLDDSGIDEKTFIDFLNQFDKSSKSSRFFDAINLTCLALGVFPSPIAMAVSIAAQTVSRTSSEIQGRYRTNTFLDQINESLFRPRGLYAMIMAFIPESPYGAVLESDINNGTDAALIRATSNPDNQLRAKLKAVRLTSGTTKGEMSLPESAPLIFPALEAAAAGAEGSPLGKKHNALKASSAFVASYLDRRAQASYALKHPESRLAVALPEEKYASRFSDPDHPANSGTILGLLTGGKYDPQASKRAKRAKERAARQGIVLSEADIHNAKLGRAKKRRQGIISRVLQRDILYLIVTNLPSESEMKDTREESERVKTGGSSQP